MIFVRATIVSAFSACHRPPALCRAVARTFDRSFARRRNAGRCVARVLQQCWSKPQSYACPLS